MKLNYLLINNTTKRMLFNLLTTSVGGWHTYASDNYYLIGNIGDEFQKTAAATLNVIKMIIHKRMAQGQRSINFRT